MTKAKKNPEEKLKTEAILEVRVGPSTNGWKKKTETFAGVLE
jgi:hypothetical protein